MVSLGASGADMASQDMHFLGMDWLRDRVRGRPLATTARRCTWSPAPVGRTGRAPRISAPGSTDPGTATLSYPSGSVVTLTERNSA